MADLTITVASVKKSTDASITNGIAGTTVTAGQSLYKDPADSNKLKLADSNASSITANGCGIAMHAALADQPLAYIAAGDVSIGATLTAGEWYFVSTTAGGICPSGDATVAASYPCLLGYAKTTAVLTVGVLSTQVAHG